MSKEDSKKGKYDKEIKELIDMSNEKPSDKNSADEIFELRGTCYVLLDAVSSIVDNLLESIPFDIIRHNDLDLISSQLKEIKITHFGEFLPEDEYEEEEDKTEDEDFEEDA